MKENLLVGRIRSRAVDLAAKLFARKVTILAEQPGADRRCCVVCSLSGSAAPREDLSCSFLSARAACGVHQPKSQTSPIAQTAGQRFAPTASDNCPKAAQSWPLQTGLDCTTRNLTI